MKNSAKIEVLREKIRQDMMDYKLAYSRESYPDKRGYFLLFNTEIDRWFSDYLEEQIDSNIAELKKRIEGEIK